MSEGSLCVMSGKTQNKYNYSILKPLAATGETICLIFVGSTQYSVYNSAKSLSSAVTSTEHSATEAEPSSDQYDSESRVVNMSILDKSFARN